jgi:hypothetical protein
VSGPDPLRGLTQYLQLYATAEAALADVVAERYRAVLVVPAFRERSGFLARYERALAGAPGRVLVIVVVNSTLSQATSSWPVNGQLLTDLRQPSGRQLSDAPPAWWARRDDYDILSIDRAGPESAFPDRQGVGLARRIGCDVALALYAAGRLERPWIYNTDADAELPPGYFDEPDVSASAATSGLVFPFWHVPGGDPSIDAATALYELGLRYYVAGLAHAGSPYAYHALGSTIAVHARAYAAVRGFPRRLAGEDFYLLNKLVKVGPLWRDDRRVVRLRSRASLRTAHGTGVAAVKLAAEWAAETHIGSTLFYHPQTFEALRYWLLVLEGFVQSRDLDRTRAHLNDIAGVMADPLRDVVSELGAWEALQQASEQTLTATGLRTRLHTWFDAFRTLKLVHGLRSRGLASLPFRQALAAAPCCTPAQAQDATVDELRRLLAEQETSLPACIGSVFDSR